MQTLTIRKLCTKSTGFTAPVAVSVTSYILLQAAILQQIQVTDKEIIHFEKKTRSQAKSSLWHKLRKHRLTASKIGEIVKRKSKFETLVKRLKHTRFICTAAMKHGIDTEPVAAVNYAKFMMDRVNLYPSGIILSNLSPWIAASPDRKVYNPARQPPFGLLEIKCPFKDNIQYVASIKSANGSRKLDKKHDYFYQVQTQLAVTGLFWCDFYVFLRQADGSVDQFCETIYFEPLFWKDLKEKLDEFYFSHYLNI